MLTEVGKFLRKLRVDNDELMKDMADKLELAPSTLSSIETGNRKPPKNFQEKLVKAYSLPQEQREQLDYAILQTKEEVGIRLHDLSREDQRTAVSFARQFEHLDDSDKAKIRNILEEDTDGEKQTL